MKRVYTLISATGWEGGGWTYRGEFHTRKEAMEHARDIKKYDARMDGYITGVIGGTKACLYHDFCRVGDTSRLGVPAHLRSRRAHIDTSKLY